MKFIMIIILAFALTPNNVLAQEPEGAANTQYKMFNKNISKLKTLDFSTQRGAFNSQLSQAENALKNVKKYDPNFDASEMEKEITHFREIKNGNVSTTSNGGNKVPPTEKKSNSNINWDKGQVTNAIKEIKITAKNRGTSITADELTKDAEEKLKILKTNHPDYDASAYEKEIADYKTKYGDHKRATEKHDLLAEEFKTQYKFVFERGNAFFDGIVISSKEEIPMILTDLKKYKKEIQEFVNSDAGKLGLSTNKSPASTKIGNLNQKGHYGLKLSVYAPTGKNRILSDYYKLKFQEAWALGLQQLFGDIDPVLYHLDKVKESLNYLKSPENAVKIAENNAQELIAQAKLLDEAMHNETLLGDLKSAVTVSSFGKGKDINNLRVVSKGWNIYRHWLSGKILYRQVAVQMTTVEDGKCILHEFIATEEYVGTSYTKCYVGYHNNREMLCEKAK